VPNHFPSISSKQSSEAEKIVSSFCSTFTGCGFGASSLGGRVFRVFLAVAFVTGFVTGLATSLGGLFFGINFSGTACE